MIYFFRFRYSKDVGVLPLYSVIKHLHSDTVVYCRLMSDIVLIFNCLKMNVFLLKIMFFLMCF